MGKNVSKETEVALYRLEQAIRGFDALSGNHTPLLEAIDALVVSRITDAVGAAATRPHSETEASP